MSGEEMAACASMHAPPDAASRRQVVAANIRRARDELDLSQRALARRLGVDPQKVWRWENDHSEPNWDNLGLIANELGKPRAWFYAEHHDEP